MQTMYLQKNSINLTYKRSKIIEYSGLSHGTYTDVNSNGICCVTDQILGAIQLIGGVLHLYSSFICWFGVIGVRFCVLWSFHSWRSRRSRREEVKRYQNSWSTDTLGGLSEHVSEICLFHWWSFFLVKSNTSDLGTTALKCQIIRIANYWTLMLKYRNFATYQGVKIWLQQFMAMELAVDEWSVSRPSHFITRERPDVAHWTGCCGGFTAMLDTVPCQELDLVLWLYRPQPSHYTKFVPVPQHSKKSIHNYIQSALRKI